MKYIRFISLISFELYTRISIDQYELTFEEKLLFIEYILETINDIFQKNEDISKTMSKMYFYFIIYIFIFTYIFLSKFCHDHGSLYKLSKICLISRYLHARL